MEFMLHWKMRSSARSNPVPTSRKKGATSTGGPARYKTPVEAACVDRRIERISISRDHLVRY